jgi:type I restriction enzyme S subunit
MRVTVGDAFEFVRNGKSIKQERDAGGLPISRIETIAEGQVDGTRVGYAGLALEGNEQWLLKPGDILFSHINSVEHVGKCAIYEGNPPRLLHGMNLLALRPSQSLYPRFALYALRQPAFRTQLLQFVNKAVNQASVSTTNLKSLPFPLPPLDEQRRIAAILDKAELLRQKRKRAIALLDGLTQSIFLEMFGSPLINELGFPTRRIDQVAVVRTGKTPPSGMPGMFGGQVPFATPADLDVELEFTKRTITASAEKFSNIARAGSTLVGCIGNIGKTARTPHRTAFNQQINAVEWNEPQADIFGRYLLPHYQPEMISRSSSAVVPILKKSSFSSIEVIDPPLHLKEQFASRIAKVLAHRKTIRSSADVHETLFASLQHRAFSSQL